MRIHHRIARLERLGAIGGDWCPECGRLANGCLPPGAAPRMHVRFAGDDEAEPTEESCPTCGATLVMELTFDVPR